MAHHDFPNAALETMHELCAGPVMWSPVPEVTQGMIIGIAIGYYHHMTGADFNSSFGAILDVWKEVSTQNSDCSCECLSLFAGPYSEAETQTLDENQQDRLKRFMERSPEFLNGVMSAARGRRSSEESA